MGGVVSRTSTGKPPLAVLARRSLDEQVTVVVPRGKVAPDGGVQATGSAPSTMSTAAASKVAAAPVGLVASRIRLPGRVRTGGVVSRTVMVKEPFAVLPLVSDAVQTTGVVPSAKVEPDTGAQVTGRAPSMSSTAVALKVATAPPGPVASSTASPGSVRTGGVKSVS